MNLEIWNKNLRILHGGWRWGTRWNMESRLDKIDKWILLTFEKQDEYQYEDHYQNKKGVKFLNESNLT